MIPYRYFILLPRQQIWLGSRVAVNVIYPRDHTILAYVTIDSYIHQPNHFIFCAVQMLTFFTCNAVKGYRPQYRGKRLQQHQMEKFSLCKNFFWQGNVTEGHGNLGRHRSLFMQYNLGTNGWPPTPNHHRRCNVPTCGASAARTTIPSAKK